jgi:hypothetical protein
MLSADSFFKKNHHPLWDGCDSIKKIYPTKTIKHVNETENDINNRVSVFRDIFNQDTMKLVDWYSGMLIIPKGKIIKSVMLGYASQYEKYTLINILNGIVQSIIDMTNKEYQKHRRLIFREYKRTNEYLEYIKNKIIKNEDTLNIDEFLFDYKF